jgi:hypothetical protein
MPSKYLCTIAKYLCLIGVWISLLSIESVAETRTSYAPQINVNSNYAFYLQLEDHNGHLWFTDPDQGFVEYDGEDWWLHQTGEQNFDRYQPWPWHRNITQDQNGKLYFEMDFYPPYWVSGFGYPSYYEINRDLNLIPLLKLEPTPCYTAAENVKNKMDAVQCRLLFDQRNRTYLEVSKSYLSKSAGNPKDYDQRNRIYIDLYRRLNVRHYTEYNLTEGYDFTDLYYRVKKTHWSDAYYRLEGTCWVSLLDAYQLTQHIRKYLGNLPKEAMNYRLHFDKQNRLWFSFSSGTEPAHSLLIMVDRQEKIHVYPKHTLYFEDSKGTLWSIFNSSPGRDKLVQLNSKNAWIPDKSITQLKHIPSLKEDQRGHLWAVIDDRHIYQKMNQIWKKMYSVSKPIKALAFDQENHLWIGSKNEIIRFHKGQQTQWKEVLYRESEADEHPNYAIESIFVDRKNNKWFQFSDDFMVGYERSYHRTPLMFDGKHWQYLWTSPLLDSPNDKRH